MSVTLNKLPRIEIARDMDEAQRFCEWLVRQGYDAVLAADSFVNGVSTFTDEQASNVFHGLYRDYCEGIA